MLGVLAGVAIASCLSSGGRVMSRGLLMLGCAILIATLTQCQLTSTFYLLSVEAGILIEVWYSL